MPLTPWAVDPRHGVELADVPVRVVERCDRTRVVEERVQVSGFGAEPELEGNVLDRVAVVVHHDLVEHVVVELPEVRTAGWQLQRNEVADEGDLVRVRRADERIDVRVVGKRILTDERRFTMARRGSVRGQRRRQTDGSEDCGECESAVRHGDLLGWRYYAAGGDSDCLGLHVTKHGGPAAGTLTLFGSCRRVSPPVLGAKRTYHGRGACAAGGDAPPGDTRPEKRRQRSGAHAARAAGRRCSWGE